MVAPSPYYIQMLQSRLGLVSPPIPGGVTRPVALSPSPPPVVIPPRGTAAMLAPPGSLPKQSAILSMAPQAAAQPAPGAIIAPQDQGGEGFNWNQFLAAALQGIAGGLDTAGRGQGFGTGFASGTAQAQNQFAAAAEAKDAKEERKLRRQEAEDRMRRMNAQDAQQAADRERFSQLSAILADGDPSNDPQSLADVMPYLPIENQMQMAGELFKGATPNSAYAKMQADVKAGLIPQSALDQWWQHEIAPPAGPGPTERQRNATAAGLRPGTPEYRSFILGEDGKGGGAFEGTGLDNQAMNILLDPNADPASPVYAAAYSHLAQPKVTYDPTTQKLVTVSPDLSWAKPPAGMGAPSAGAGNAPQTAAGVQPGLQSFPGQSGQTQTLQVPGAKITASPGVPTFTEAQGKAATFADRLSAANGTLEQTFEAGSDPVQKGLSLLPGVGNYLVSPATQQFMQAERDFINAQLRRESGAVISDAEFKEARQQYIPQPGDSKAVLEQKKAARERALKGMARDAGPSYQPPQDTPPVVPKGGKRIQSLPPGNWSD